ncbi:hypothetical protein [Moritella sp.]|uniref:hypothetical protein n=1 Tax=Moritella sp. TaxID=78556 RepID=UPI001DF8578E|nr:hypothetical protein [Moritella sp.]MCJ8351186.1 hypothetical protein [Moritella sp.]NQZ41468.1 hypothetical protein [Moritella sp.]
MSYKLILLSDLKPTDLNMVLRPHVAVDIIRELHLQHIQIWDLDWHNDHADFMSSPADKYARVIEKLLLGHVVLLQWPQARFDGVFDHSGNVHLSMTMGIGNELLTSKVRTLQESIVERENHSPAAESKPLSKPIVVPAKTPVAAPARTIKDAAVAGPFEIEVELLDETETPIANAEYILKLATGEERTGQLDGNGYKLFSGTEYKRSEIHFPQYEGYDWERGAASQKYQQVSSVTQNPISAQSQTDKPVLIEFKLLDHDDTPMANEAYLVTLSSGDEVNGKLDADGYVQLCGAEYKNAKICFPEFDGEDWS